MRALMVSLFSALACIEFLSRWYYSRDEDYLEACELPHRWVCWGTCRSMPPNDGRWDFRYVLIRFPSYDWQPSLAWGDGRLICLQRALLKFAGEWRLTFVEPIRA